MPDQTPQDPITRPAGGIVHSYQRYDPREFPSPTAPAPDVASAAFEHMLEFGNLRELTEEELARAVKLDPSMFPRLGPSIESLIAMLRERRQKILETYETLEAQALAKRAYSDVSHGLSVPREYRDVLARAIAQEQISDLEKLWYRQKDEASDFARGLLRLIERLGDKYQVDELAGKYAFTGREPLTVAEALEIKEELESIDSLLEQLKQASQTAQLAVIDMESLEQFADSGEMENLNRLQREIEDYMREAARNQGLERSKEGFRLTPGATRLFQRRLLTEIFSDLSQARSGRHNDPVVGDGVIEMQRTRPYEFGDASGNMDTVGTLLNAAARWAGAGGRDVQSRDISVHLTRNTPRCATMVLMDMSGSMRYGGQYIQCKRMALAFDGLIRTEYPGDFLGFVEMSTFARLKAVGEVAAMMPKMVTIHQPVVRLRADMGDPRMSEMRVPQHFTNIQHALSLARQVLRNQPTPNRQVALITDGLPTAHFEGSDLLMLYPPDPRTEAATMREAMLCGQEGITINIFLLPSWSQSSEDVQFAHRMAETSRGRVFFTGGKDLDRFVLWDYVKRRRGIIA